MIKSTRSYTCPFNGCKHSQDTPNLMRDHLITNHNESLHKIPQTWWKHTELYPCPTCDNKTIFKSQGFLNRHILQKHTQKEKDADNLVLITKYLPTPENSQSEWNKTLPWLHNLKLTPPPFRQNIWYNTNISAKNKIKFTYHKIICILVDSKHKPDTRPNIPHLHQRDALWKLAILFESLILHPIPKNSKKGTAEHITQRLHLLQTGNIQTLYNMSRSITSLSPLQKKERSQNMTQQKIQKTAQMAADMDNYKTALDRLNQLTPIAINTEENIKILKSLYPKQHTITNIGEETNKYIPENEMKIEDFHKIITRIPKGKAAGPFADISDIIRALAIHKDLHNKNFPYVKKTFEFFKMITQDNIPKNIKKYFTSSFVFGLHKDPKDLTKLRPVAVGGGWRRAFTSVLVRHNNNIFTKYLLPYNYAIGVRGGTNFIYHTLSCEVDKYMKRTKEETSTNPPTRCLISLDIQNMFNEISRQKTKEIISNNFPHLIKYTNLLINEPTQCWYLKPSGGWDFFNQEEGLPQGCPFSPVFAALVLHSIIKPIDKELKKRAQTRYEKGLLGDDKKGSRTNLMAYVDDLNCVIPYEDAYFFCKKFKELATKIGLKLNNKKSSILTNTNKISIKPFISNQNRNNLEKCLKEFTENKENNEGVTILGFPIGNTSYIMQKMTDLTKKVTTSFNLTKDNLESIQTVGQIFTHTLIPKFYYTLCADVFLHAKTSNNIYEYNSTHSKEINNTFTQVLKYLTKEDIIPQHVKELSERPTSQNGLHLLNPSKSAITATCAPILKSIQMAKEGIPTGQEHIILPSPIRNIYKNWTKSENNIFTTLNTHITQIISTLEKNNTTQISTQYIEDFSYNCPAHLIHEKIMHEFYEQNKHKIFNITPPKSRHILPGILTSKIPTTLLKPNRQTKENRIANEDFILSMRRSHRMHILNKDITLKCKCGSIIDNFGDHLFKCTRHSKTKLHNHIRNTIHFITENIGIHANFIKSKDGCTKEEIGLIPAYPLIRPGDIIIHPNRKNKNNFNQNKDKIIAIDCTIKENLPDKTINPENYEQANFNHIKHHILCEYKKYNRPNQKSGNTQINGENIMKEINKQNIILKAFTIDQHGALGPQAEYFFYGNKNKTTYETINVSKKLTTPGEIALIRNKEDEKFINIFKHSNEGWNLTNRNEWFGNTYQTTTPSTWGNLYLHTNINHAIIKHIKSSMEKIESPITSQTENKKYTILGRQALENKETPNDNTKKGEKHDKINKKHRQELCHVTKTNKFYLQENNVNIPNTHNHTSLKDNNPMKTWNPLIS